MSVSEVLRSLVGCGGGRFGLPANRSLEFRFEVSYRVPLSLRPLG